VHVADGVLSVPVLVGATALAGTGLAIGLRRLEPDDVPRVGMAAALFFVASLVHVPVGVASAHLVLTGLMGLLLGWAAFPAFLAALLLQVLLFGYGGVTVLGANLLIFAAPAVACWALARRVGRTAPPARLATLAAAIGAVGVLGSALVLAALLGASGRELAPAAALVVGAHVPVLIAEAFVTAAAVTAVARAKPELLPWRAAAS
jgi:cobalt/nickel transport system permease protein